jgi:hypothetical protein
MVTLQWDYQKYQAKELKNMPFQLLYKNQTKMYT